MDDPDQESALSEIAADARLTAVYQYWRSLRGEEEVPAFSGLDPLGLPPAVLPYLSLLDVIDGGRSFRVRLVGTGTTAAVGRTVTGKTLEAAGGGDILETALARYRAVLLHRRPVVDIVEYAMPDGLHFKTRLMTLPFSTEASRIDRLLGVYSPSSAPAAQRNLRDLAIPPNARVTRSQTVL